MCWPFLSLVIAALIRGQEWRMKGLKGQDIVYVGTLYTVYVTSSTIGRVRVVVGEGLSGYPQIGTRGIEGYGQHFGRCSSNDIYTNPLLFLFLFLLFNYCYCCCWLCGGGDRPDPITCREAWRGRGMDDGPITARELG